MYRDVNINYLLIYFVVASPEPEPSKLKCNEKRNVLDKGLRSTPLPEGIK